MPGFYAAHSTDKFQTNILTRPRSCLVSPAITRWYHCVSRCVRRAYLCGEDSASGKNYEHRRPWIIGHLKKLSKVFAIDIAAYAVMSNHYHLVVHLAPERANGWSDDEVLLRWTRLFSGPLLVKTHLSAPTGALPPAEAQRLHEQATIFRARLQDLSWFIRILNQSIACMANAEDLCRGRFWEGRFKSQALLDEHAVLAAMIYVDLNPVRSCMAATPEDSEHASIHDRLNALSGGLPESGLMPFDPTRQMPWAIPFGLGDYVELVDWIGRRQRPDKRGHIGSAQLPILQRLNVSAEAFAEASNRSLKLFGNAIGSPEAMVEYCAKRQMKRLRGVNAARRMFAK